MVGHFKINLILMISSHKALHHFCKFDQNCLYDFFKILHNETSCESDHFYRPKAQHHQTKLSCSDLKPSIDWIQYKTGSTSINDSNFDSSTLRSLINVQCMLIDFLKKSSLYALIKDL